MKNARFRAALLPLAALATWAAPPLTTIQDTVYKADGSRFDGYAIIDWRSFDASDTSFIGKNSIQVRVSNGLLNVRLVPTTTAVSTAYYSVRYVSNGNIQFSEFWAVPPSGNPVRVGGVEIADVAGLEGALEIRPVRSATFSHPRAAVINVDGAIESAAGNPDDCVRVDGTSGPCGSGGGSAVVGTFVDGETPQGAANGSNRNFTLSVAPNPSTSLLLYRNGVLQKRFLDYTLSGTTVTFESVATPQTGDVLLASFRTAGSGGTLPQVLCTGTGSGTSNNTSVSLGTCTVPGGLLRSGDRLEVLFDYSHEGSTVGYQLEVRFGSTTLVSRTAPADSGLATGRASLGFHAGGTQWSAQSWGHSVGLASTVGSAAENIVADLVFDFRGQLSSPSVETTTLRNFSVVRYPAP
jgi:hypothetical protein